jgi:hypothetical protein
VAAEAVVVTVAVTVTGASELPIVAMLGATVQVGLSTPFAPLGDDAITHPRPMAPV